MTNIFRPYTQDQPLLLPPDLREWLPEGDLALFISDVVDALDLSAIYRTYERTDGRGQAAYHPALMVKLLLLLSDASTLLLESIASTMISALPVAWSAVGVKLRDRFDGSASPPMRVRAPRLSSRASSSRLTMPPAESMIPVAAIRPTAFILSWVEIPRTAVSDAMTSAAWK